MQIQTGGRIMSFPNKSQGSDSLSRTVIEAVAEKKEIEPIALPPLYESVDPETLNSLFEQTETGTLRTIEIEFVYDGFLITVTVDDEFTISISEIGEL